MKNKLKKIGWGVLLLFCIAITVFLYTTLFRPRYGNSNVFPMLIAGLLLGIVIAYLSFQLISIRRREKKTLESSHTVVESMRKVFKIVCAEGQFHEIYNYEETKKLLKIIPSTKRALVIVQAKVMMGFDFEKCVWEKDEENRKIKIVSFPEPEILSLEPEYKYYYIEEDIFNMISREDLHHIQEAGKKQVMEAALKSDLNKIAVTQMHTMLQEVITANHWGLENGRKINALDQVVDEVPPSGAKSSIS